MIFHILGVGVLPRNGWRCSEARSGSGVAYMRLPFQIAAVRCCPFGNIVPIFGMYDHCNYNRIAARSVWTSLRLHNNAVHMRYNTGRRIASIFCLASTSKRCPFVGYGFFASADSFDIMGSDCVYLQVSRIRTV